MNTIETTKKTENIKKEYKKSILLKHGKLEQQTKAGVASSNAVDSGSS